MDLDALYLDRVNSDKENWDGVWIPMVGVELDRVWIQRI